MAEDKSKNEDTNEGDEVAAEDMSFADLKAEAVERELDIKGVRSKTAMIALLEDADAKEAGEEQGNDEKPRGGGSTQERIRRKAGRGKNICRCYQG